jgi:phosphate transport system substrate-binding protein
MKKINYLVLVVVGVIAIYSCNQKNESETILTGTATILVDETILPVIEDQVMVFENQYEAKINLVPKSESEIVKLLSEGKNDLAILTRELTNGEAVYFENKKIKARVTPIASDGVAFIAHKSLATSQIELNDIVAMIQGKSSKYAGLVFDNANSSTVKYFKDLAKVKELPKEKIFSFKTNNEVIDFVSKNTGMIGVVGINWILQPMPNFKKTVDNVSVLEVKANNGTFAKPSQEDIATGLYPVIRQIKMLNYQGTRGLGMGFASFIGGEIGQRIILKSGLVPVRMPGRNIIIRKEVENKKDN